MPTIQIVAGDTVAAGDVVITLKNGSTVVNLTGCTPRWKRRFRSSPIGVAEETTVMAIQGAATLGQVTPAYTSAQSQALQLGEHVVQIEVTDGTGAVRTYPTPDQEPIKLLVTEGL